MNSECVSVELSSDGNFADMFILNRGTVQLFVGSLIRLPSGPTAWPCDVKLRPGSQIFLMGSFYLACETISNV